LYPTCLTIVTLTCTDAIYFCRYKGEAEYNAPPKTVFEYVEPLPNGPRPKWDKNMKKIEILKWIDEPVRVVTAHYEHYAHDEWSIRDLLHWQNYPSIPITFPCFESRGV
jgi:hypothetical protein